MSGKKHASRGNFGELRPLWRYAQAQIDEWLRENSDQTLDGLMDDFFLDEDIDAIQESELLAAIHMLSPSPGRDPADRFQAYVTAILVNLRLFEVYWAMEEKMAAVKSLYAAIEHFGAIKSLYVRDEQIEEEKIFHDTKLKKKEKASKAAKSSGFAKIVQAEFCRLGGKLQPIDRRTVDSMIEGVKKELFVFSENVHDPFKPENWDEEKLTKLIRRWYEKSQAFSGGVNKLLVKVSNSVFDVK